MTVIFAKPYFSNKKDNIKPSTEVAIEDESYGVITKRIDDVWKIKRLQPNSTAESEWFSGDVSSTYIDIEVAE